MPAVAATHELQHEVLTECHLTERTLQIPHPRKRLSIQFEQQITEHQSSTFSRAAGLHGHDEKRGGSPRVLGERLGQGYRLDRDAQVRAQNSAVRDQGIDNP